MRATNLRTGQSAISPVIGVVLLVAITVILVAATGAVVLGIGVGNLTPQADIDISGQETEFENTNGPSDESVNLTVVEIQHVSGDEIDTENLELSVEGTSGTPFGIERGSRDNVWRSFDSTSTLTAGTSTTIAFIDVSPSYSSGDPVYYTARSVSNDEIVSIGGPTQTVDVREIRAGDTVQVVWVSDDGETSTVLAEEEI